MRSKPITLRLYRPKVYLTNWYSLEVYFSGNLAPTEWPRYIDRYILYLDRGGLLLNRPVIRELTCGCCSTGLPSRLLCKAGIADQCIHIVLYSEAATQRCSSKKKPLPKCDFNKVTKQLRHECSPVKLLHIFRTPLLKNTSGLLLLYIHILNETKTQESPGSSSHHIDPDQNFVQHNS